MTVHKYLREDPPQRKRHTMHGQQCAGTIRALPACAVGSRLPHRDRALAGDPGARVCPLADHRPALRQPAASRGASPAWAAAHGAHQTAGTIAPAGRRAHPAAGLERRTAEQRAYLTHLCAADATITTAVAVAADFLVMLRRREGERLPAWLEAAEASGISELERFARTLREDLAAVQAGQTLRHSNGQTEGQVNRLKLLKRQGYGRANLDLLRKRVLRRPDRHRYPRALHQILPVHHKCGRASMSWRGVIGIVPRPARRRLAWRCGRRVGVSFRTSCQGADNIAAARSATPLPAEWMNDPCCRRRRYPCWARDRGALAPLLTGLRDEVDILFLAGDLTRAGKPAEAEILAAELAEVGILVVAVLGNHDYHFDQAPAIITILKEAGIHVLDRSSIVLDIDGQRPTRRHQGLRRRVRRRAG